MTHPRSMKRFIPFVITVGCFLASFVMPTLNGSPPELGYMAAWVSLQLLHQTLTTGFSNELGVSGALAGFSVLANIWFGFETVRSFLPSVGERYRGWTIFLACLASVLAWYPCFFFFGTASNALSFGYFFWAGSILLMAYLVLQRQKFD